MAGYNARFSFFLLLYVFISTGMALGQRIPDPQFLKYITIEDGLPQNVVNAILQDEQDFMWFGTKDGLARYDGYEFRVFTHNPKDQSSLSNNYVTALCETPSGNMLIGTVNGCVDVFHLKTEEFKSLTLNGNSKLNKKVLDMSQGPDSTLWASFDQGGLWVLKKEADQFDLIKGSIEKFGNVNDFEWIQNRLIIATDQGLFEIHPSDNHWRFEELIVDQSKMSGLNEKCKTAYFSLDVVDDILWAGNICGVLEYNLGENASRYYPHKYAEYRRGWGTIFVLDKVDQRYLWMGTREDLFLFDTELREYYYYNVALPNLPRTGINAIFKDKSGVVWLGLNGGGVCIWSKNAFRFNVFKKETVKSERSLVFSVRTLYEDIRRDVWISAGVLYRWNPRTNQMKSYQHDSYHPESFGNTTVLSIIEDRYHNMWFGATEGLYFYDPITENAQHLPFTMEQIDRYGDKTVNEIFEDSKGQIWFTVGKFLCKVTQESGVYEEYPILDFRLNDVSGFESIYEDKTGHFWMNTSNGLLRFDPISNAHKFYQQDPENEHSLSYDDVKCLWPDPQFPDQILWLGTGGGGLNKFYIQEERFVQYSTEDGLANNVVYGILSDSNHQLWLSTNSGLSRFDPQNEQFVNYTTEDGLQSNEFNSNAYFKGESGFLYFGGIEGFNYFDPDEVQQNPALPEVVITDFKIANQSISLRDSLALLTHSLSYTDTITLSYQQANIFSFTFAGLEYTSSNKNRYQYQLNGIHSDWIEAGKERTATYTNIPPGNYRFTVKASNNDGIWNEQGRSIFMVIRPPYWATPWAYSFYVLLAISIIYLIIRYYLKRRRLQKSLLYQELERKKLLELDQVKSQFFANISHDLRTPLTLIKSPIDVLLSENLPSSQRKMLKVVDKSADRLLNLIDQILEISKLDSQDFQLDVEKADIVVFAKGVFSSYAFYAEQRGITLSSSIEIEDTTKILFDRLQLEKVFHNLISNAFKHTPELGEITLTIGTQGSEIYKLPEGNYIALAIANTGSSVPEEELPKLFRKYYTYENKKSGAGIGLTIVKEMVELHGGQVRVENIKGGIRFTVYLPCGPSQIINPTLSKVNEIIAIPLKPFQHSETTQDIPPKSLSSIFIDKPLILVVEDTFELNHFLCQVIEEEYRVISAKDGVEGLELALNHIPDLILSDLMMPRMDGFEFCRRIRGDLKTCHIPFLMLTARTLETDIAQGFSYHIDQFMVKPFSSTELIARIEGLLAQRKLLKEIFTKESATWLETTNITDKNIEFQKGILLLLEKNLSNPNFSTADLCEEFYMSDRQMRRKINSVFNLSPNQLIRNYRLEQAKKLINETDMTIGEISDKVGFNELSYFSRKYKEYFGHSPSDVRVL